MSKFINEINKFQKHISSSIDSFYKNKEESIKGSSNPVYDRYAEHVYSSGKVIIYHEQDTE